MRVLMISDYADPASKVGSKRFGGISVYIKNLSENLAKKGVKVDIFTPQGQSKKLFNINSKLRYITIPSSNREDFKNKILDFIYKQDLKYDIIHSNYWFGGIVSIDIANELNLPQVHIFHSNGKIRLGFLKEAGLDKTDKVIKPRIDAETEIAKKLKNIIASSPIEKNTLSKTYGIKKSDIEVIPIGVSKKIFKSISQKTARKKLGLPLDSKIIIFVSRIEENKGATVLINSLPLVIAKNPNTKLLIVGGEESQKNKGSEIYELNKQAERLGVSQNIIFVGQVDQNKLYTYYCAADVCAMPSFYETFGIVPLESMACKTPVVASRTGGLTFTVRTDISGYLVKPKDEKDLSKKILKVFKKGRDYFSETCTTLIDENFLWENITQDYINYYEFVIDTYNRSQRRMLLTAQQRVGITI